ncbi:polygalacturonase inhibitor-like [Phalaenopsis equestris]|uniref:polygalacturonase inhibitor-like n=1 Tax=Phalaenopsis equestris TaxID=78828 RepID=UPI0009E516F2|nr:polygalacturonase inhibitor-like [Phalaenopsis equestris]
MPPTILTISSPPIISTIFFLLLLYSPSSLAAGNCFPGDKKALLTIKYAFNNPEILANWTNETACCDWTGVQCLDSRIISLRITGSSSLSGFLPYAIGNLPFLKTLILSDLPGLEYSIPYSISHLTHLSTLILSNTSLSGKIPSTLSRLGSLQLLRLSRNRLSGEIPKSFGSFDGSSPPRLDLSNNDLSGEIPAELGNIDWGFIDLSNNRLEGDASVLFGAGKNVTIMNLSSNKFRFDLSKVRFPVGLGALFLNRNEIYGIIPAQINRLIHLIVLNLSDNQLCGAIPAGQVTREFPKQSYLGNKCLCGAPLDLCP